jgi:two-component system KDP operon response regulator KdpE
MTIYGNQLPDQGILLVDDDASLLQVMEFAFSYEGYSLYTASNGQQGLRQLFDHRPDLVILDLRMPVMDGWETCRRIRQLSAVPIIILTGLGGADNILRGLDEVGADDYLVKPLEVRILLAKVRALLRRAALPPELNKALIYTDGYLTLDLGEGRVLVQEEPVKLTSREYELLLYLYRYADQLRPHRQILQDLWNWQEPDSIDIVHKYIRRLRQKLEPDPRQPRYLLTEHGIGYRFKKFPRIK